MRIRSVLLLAFLYVSIIPALVFGVGAYREGLRNELRDVEDRHLLLARGLGNTLKRYHVDLVAAINSISKSMLSGHSLPELHNLMRQLNIDYVLIVDKETGEVSERIAGEATDIQRINPELHEYLRKLANPIEIIFSPVVVSENGANVLFAVREFGNRLAVAKVNTKFFVELGNTIDFGNRGHAAIVDQKGNILAHPLPSWVADRKNISKVSAVQRMMKGETGIQRFYSPALKGDMIAGLTAVDGPGWGVMIPQPVSELYGRVHENNRSIFFATGLGIVISLALAWLLLNFLSRPLEQLTSALNKNRETGRLGKIAIPSAHFTIREFDEFKVSYNAMVETVGQANEKAEKLAYTDSVTDLPSRARFNELVETEVAEASSRSSEGILVFIDIDNFKEVNDVHGHEVGDRLLCAIADKLCQLAEACNCSTNFGKTNSNLPAVSRIGGDEFTMLVPGISEHDEIQWLLDELLEAISSIGSEWSISINCSASIGCARYPQDGNTLEDLIRHADIAMYQAKRAGKSQAQLYDPSVAAATETEIRSEFSKAIANGELALEYQPKICTRRKVVAGVEALVRWDHPKLGRLSPLFWLPAISQSSLIHELGDWVVRTAIEDQSGWHDRGYLLTVSVNLSSEQFANKHLASQLSDQANAMGLDPGYLELEITEDALFSDKDHALKALKQIKKAGFKISIDDFGKGYSNFARLAEMPLDFIKIDQSLIDGALSSKRLDAILDAMINVARELDCKIVAEGIETLEHAEFATRKGANLLQGYFFAGSMPSGSLIDWIESSGLETMLLYRQKTSLEAA